MKHALLLLIVLLGAAAAACASGVSEDEVFTATGIDSVDVRAEFLDVEVRADDGFTVSVDSQLPSESIFESRGYRLLH
jgi:hypothetical protein